MNHLYIVSFILICIGTGACKTQKPTSSTISNITSNQNNAPQVATTDQLLFLVFQIKKNIEGAYSKITLIKREKVNGKLKQGHINEDTFENELIIYQYNHQTLIDSIVCEHPLYKNLEDFNGNTMTTRQVELDSAEFFIRLQLDSKTNEIKIYEKLKQNKLQQINSIKL